MDQNRGGGTGLGDSGDQNRGGGRGLGDLGTKTEATNILTRQTVSVVSLVFLFFMLPAIDIYYSL